MPRYTSLSQLQTAIHSGETTLVELVRYYLSQIEMTKDLNAYVEVFDDEAIQKAQELDVKFQANPASVGRLFGMVVSIKDVLCYKNHQVTAASSGCWQKMRLSLGGRIVMSLRWVLQTKIPIMVR